MEAPNTDAHLKDRSLQGFLQKFFSIPEEERKKQLVTPEQRTSYRRLEAEHFRRKELTQQRAFLVQKLRELDATLQQTQGKISLCEELFHETMVPALTLGEVETLVSDAVAAPAVNAAKKKPQPNGEVQHGT